MIRHRMLVCVGLFALAQPILAADKPKVPEGAWEIKVFEGGRNQVGLAIIKIENEDGKVKSSVVASPAFFKPDSSTATVDGKVLKIVFATPRGEWTLEAVLPAKDEKTLHGSLNLAGQALFPVMMASTDKTEIAKEDEQKPLKIDQLGEISGLQLAPLRLRFQAAQEKDADKKAELLKKAEEEDKTAAEKLPKLVQEVVDTNKELPIAADYGLVVLNALSKVNYDADQSKKWIDITEKAAEACGPAYSQNTRFKIGNALESTPGAEKVAIEYAKGLEKALTEKDPPTAQVQVLKLLAAAYKKAGKAEDAKAMEPRIEKVEVVLDKEYSAKVPPYKPEKFEGRTGKSKRVVVMELFTGAQCPPCVAADVGFDGLEKTYSPKDVALLQYHVHIPGPDPLTNADSVARMDFYAKLFPQEVRGTPSPIFDGKAQAGGGGGMDFSKNKYEEFRKIIEPRLDEKEEVDLTAKVTRKGDKIDIEAEVKGLKDPDEDKKLRFVLAEEAIRYVGSNNVRFHHHVVRAFPGGLEGIQLKDKDTKQTVSVNLDELRKKLADYLEDYNKKSAFPNADRPLAFKHLLVVALVQNDKTGEILQAQQIEVPEEGGKD